MDTNPMTEDIIKTYKEKKIEEIKSKAESMYEGESLFPISVINEYAVVDFLSKTIDEIIGCLPEERKRGIEDFASESIGLMYEDWKKGYNQCRENFISHLKDKIK
jgi:hypothetical protein